MTTQPVRRIVITGGMGFVGRHLEDGLIRLTSNCEVVVVDCRNRPRQGLALSSQPPGHQVTMDLAHERSLDHLLDPETLVFHLAGETHVQASLARPADFLHSNVSATFQVLESARRSDASLVVASSSEVYGDGAPRGKIHEDSPLRPKSPYAATKAAADRMTYAYIQAFGLRAVIVRLFNNYGPGQYFEKLVPMVTCSTLLGLPVPVQGDGAASRDWTYVGDTVDRLLRLIERWPSVSVINCGSGRTASVGELASRIGGIVGHAPVAMKLPDRPGQVVSQRACTRLVDAELGDAPTDLDEGLRRTVDWYRDTRRLWETRFLEDRQRILGELRPGRHDH